MTYRIVKLRSGEELIAVVKGVNANTVVVERPMQVRIATTHHPVTGEVLRETTVLKSWLSGTNEIECDIPRDFIVTTLIPNEKTIEKYETEKEKEDQYKELGLDLSDINELVDKLAKQIGLPSPENPDNKMPPIPGAEEIIVMSFAIPKNIFENLVESGILSDDLEDIPLDDFGFEEVEDDERTEENEDWGNNFSDWSEDLEDYLGDG
tara:strand:+ start:1118 stop:1741 length:624 start_codon:yes stop_codon:yes gene_type:complete